MIIGVSGYSGSGKDTVGTIIQYLKCSNPQSSIEQMCADYSEYEYWLDEQSGWEIRKFAGKLKDIASHLTGIDIEDFEDQNFKKRNLGPEWGGYTVIRKETPSTEEKIYKTYSTYKEAEGFIYGTCKKYSDVYTKDDFYINEEPMTVRDFLQKLGTDALRNGLHPNVWVNALMADYINDDQTGQLPNWIITDVRFPNEAQAIKDKGGIMIRVDRPGIKPINAHPSEIGLDTWKFDYRIANVSDIYTLKETIREILKHAKLL